MDHSLQPINLDSLVESALLRNILDDSEIQLGHRHVGVRVPDLLGLLL